MLTTLARTLYRAAERRESRKADPGIRKYKFQYALWVAMQLIGLAWIVWAAWSLYPTAGKAVAGIATFYAAWALIERRTQTDAYTEHGTTDPLMRRRNHA